MLFRTRKIVKPCDLNPHQTLFGGRVLEWLDEECAIFASCQLRNNASLVTRFISQIDFVSPARLGEVVEIGVERIAVGKTSISVRCEVRNKNTKAVICRIEKIVFVCVDADGHATPHGCTEADCRQQEELARASGA